MDTSQFNSMQFTQGSLSMTSGLRKLDLGAGKGLGLNAAPTGGALPQPSFYQTQNLNQMQSMNTPAYMNPQQTMGSDDLNQRQGPMSFGVGLNSFGGNGAGHLGAQQQHNNILNQSIDSTNSANSNVGSSFHSPKNGNQNVMSSNNYMKPTQSLMQAGFSQTRQATNVFAYGAQAPTIGGQNQNAYNQFPNQYSTISSQASEINETPYKQTPQTVQSTPFSYGGSNINHQLRSQGSSLQLGVPDNSFQKGFKFNQTIYENNVIVRFKASEREDFDQQLHIKLALQAQSITSSQQLLIIEVTDETNAYFLYTLDCMESDFHMIKQSQQLHFDFQTFPHFIADQLEKCMAYFKTEQPMQSLRRNICQLQIGVSNEATLAFIEQNQYQSLVVLHLKLKQGNDESIKKHLASKVKDQCEQTQKQKEICESLKMNIMALEDQISMLKQENESLKENNYRSNEQLLAEINNLKEENKRIVTQMRLEQEKNMHEMREKQLLEQAELQARFDNDKRLLAVQHEKDKKGLQEQIQVHLEENRALLDQIKAKNDEFLQFRASQNQEIMKYTDKIKQQQDEYAQLSKQLSYEQCSVHDQISLKAKEYEKIIKELNENWELKMQQYELNLHKVHDNHLKIIEQMQEKIDKRERMLEEKKEIDFMNKDLKNKIENLYNEIDQKQKIVDQKDIQICSLESQIELLRNEMGYLRDINKGVEGIKISEERVMSEFSNMNVFQIHQSLREFQFKMQSLQREIDDKEQIIQRMHALVDSAKVQKAQVEQSLLDEKAKTNKMQDKLMLSKQEIENAQKYIEKLKQEKKDLQKKIKTKNSVVLQQETQIQQKQDQVNEQVKIQDDLRKEILDQAAKYMKEIQKIQGVVADKDLEIKELNSLNNMLKQKLEESQKSLESNAQMISWLNKQLNDKPGLGASVLPSSFKNTTTNQIMSKPPVTGPQPSSFKPSFGTVDQLSSTSTSNNNGNTFERSPFRNTTTASINTPSSMTSINTSISNSFVSANNKPQTTTTAPMSKPPTTQSYTPNTFNYPPKPTNENVSSNLPVIKPPQFVSKYAQQLYQEQQQQEAKPLSNTNGFTRTYSQSSLSSGSSSMSSQQNSSECNYGSSSSANLAGTMSFNPYQPNKYSSIGGQQEDASQVQNKLSCLKIGTTNTFEDDNGTLSEAGNNDTQMSGGDAFQAFLSKNDGDQDEE